MGRAPTQIKKTTDPEVILDLLWQERIFYFVLYCRKEKPVTDIRVSFRRKVIGLGGTVDIAALPIWSRLAFLPPEKRISVTIDRDEVFFANNRSEPLAASLTYTDADKVTWRAQITHDFGAYQNFPDLRLR